MTKTKIVAITKVYKPPKRKCGKGHFKGQKRPYFCFSTIRVFIRSIYMAGRAYIIGIENMAKFRYGSLQHAPF